MFVILSQKVDNASSYEDKIFGLYHYPAMYKNLLHSGDIFVYYQGNRYNKSQRYYFGTGVVGKIWTENEESYFAELLNCKKFPQKVPIYLPDGGYIEQLGYETVRKRINPPWQSSIRPLSQKAYEYIITAAGVQRLATAIPNDSIDELKDQLKIAVKRFYVKNDASAIQDIENIAATIGSTILPPKEEQKCSVNPQKAIFTENVSKLSSLIHYCQSMKMSYSYKPVLVLSILDYGDKNGGISLERVTRYFREYYSSRKKQGMAIEKRQCIYLRDDVTDKEIISNLISNPVKALLKSGFFSYDEDAQTFSILPEIWEKMDVFSKSEIKRICIQRLSEYYSNDDTGAIADGLEINWKADAEIILERQCVILDVILKETGFRAARNPTRGQKNLNLYVDGKSRRIGQVWLEKRKKLVNLCLANEYIDKARLKMKLPAITEIKNVVNQREFKYIPFEKAVEIICAAFCG